MNTFWCIVIGYMILSAVGTIITGLFLKGSKDKERDTSSLKKTIDLPAGEIIIPGPVYIKDGKVYNCVDYKPLTNKRGC